MIIKIASNLKELKAIIRKYPNAFIFYPSTPGRVVTYPVTVEITE